MELNDLFEDAEGDVRRSQIADAVFQSAVSYLYKLEKQGGQLPTAILGGKNVPCLPAEDFDAPQMFRDLLFVFENNDYAMGGRAVKMKERLGERYQYIVVIGVDGDTVSDIYKALRYDRVREVVRHELQHIIDYKRYKGDVFKSKEPNFKADDGGIKPSKMSDGENRDYHNSSAETNAYFHNLAEPLLQRIRFMQQHGVEMAGLFEPLPRDFREYLTVHLKNKYGIIKRHWDALTAEKRNKALSRLHKLFDLYWQMVDKYEKSSSEVEE